jgi:protein gp37
MSWRIQNNPKRPDRYEGVVRQSEAVHVETGEHKTALHWTGRINLDYDALEKPYRWRKPRTVFVQSMGDLFHEKVPDEFIKAVWGAMARQPRHTFLVLTKRAERMMDWVSTDASGGRPHKYIENGRIIKAWGSPVDWPLPNVWLGVTAENQEQADLRIPLLLRTPAAVRWVSVEPMLSAIDFKGGRLYGDGWFTEYDPHETSGLYPCYAQGVDWAVISAESGPNRRAMRQKWALDLIDQCDAAGASVFVKQISSQPDASKNPDDWPVELRRREWPR